MLPLQVTREWRIFNMVKHMGVVCRKHFSKCVHYISNKLPFDAGIHIIFRYSQIKSIGSTSSLSGFCGDFELIVGNFYFDKDGMVTFLGGGGWTFCCCCGCHNALPVRSCMFCCLILHPSLHIYTPTQREVKHCSLCYLKVCSKKCVCCLILSAMFLINSSLPVWRGSVAGHPNFYELIFWKMKNETFPKEYKGWITKYILMHFDAFVMYVFCDRIFHLWISIFACSHLF